MAGRRKQYSNDFKVRVALEAIKGQKTANEIASEYSVFFTIQPDIIFLNLVPLTRKLPSCH